MDDVALVAAVQRGDEEALADLFEECHGWTYSTCLNALRDPDAAAEATGRVFEATVRDRLAGASELRPAMIRLIHSVCAELEQELSAKRGKKRKGEQPPAAPDPKELRLVAWRAAGDLSGPDRILFALSAGAGLTIETIATAVDPEKPEAIAERLEAIREHVVADVLAARSLDDCPELRDTLRYSAKEPDNAARKKVHAHRAGRKACGKCAKAYERWPLPALAALLPLTAVPAGLNDQVLDRMELALRAAEAEVRRTEPSASAVIDAATGRVIDPEPRNHRVSGARSDSAPSARGPRHGAGAGQGAEKHRRFAGATTVTLVIAVLVVSTAGAVALNTHRRGGGVTEKLAADRAPRPSTGKPARVVASPAGAHAAPARRSAASPTPADEVELPLARTSPSAAAVPSIRPVAGAVAPSSPAPADPFAGFGTLTIASPGGTLAVGEGEAANVTLSVEVPAGFDPALLDSALTWSGTYALKKVTQYADLGAGQDVNAELATAPRCNTAWTITATLTPPDGATQTATTTVTLATC